MAKLTKEQFDKWSAKASNGFTFNVKKYVCWGEKGLEKIIQLGDGRVVEFEIGYSDEYAKVTNEHSVSYNRRTGRKIPVLDINILVPSSTKGVYRVHHFKSDIVVGETQDKNNFNVLCQCSKYVDTDMYMKEITAVA